MKKNGERILGLDIFRGYLLLVIVIDHLYRFPGIFDIFTGQGKLWVSAAEGFFIISGLLVGYKRYSLNKLWKRAFKLYVISILLTLIFTAWGMFLPPSHLEKTGIWGGGSIIDLIVKTLTFRYVYGWADFLPFYAVFLFFSPVAIFLLSKKKWYLVLVGSFLLWVVRGGNEYLAWQLVFSLGLLGGYYLPSIQKILNRFQASLIIFTLISIFTSFYFVFIRNVGMDFMGNLFDKDTQGFGRVILSLVWFSTFYLIIRKNEDFINRATRGVLVLLGQNSLFVYVLHAFLIFPLNVIFPGGSILRNVITEVGVISIIILSSVIFKKGKRIIAS